MKLIDPRLLRQAKSSRLALGLTITLGFVGGVLIVIQAWLLSRVINGVFLGEVDLRDSAPMLGVLVLLFPRRGVLGSLYTVYHRTHGTRIHLFSPQEMSALLLQAGLTPPLRWRDCLMSSVCTARVAQGESGC